jgi:mono/diheme cytochrome c family protein
MKKLIVMSGIVGLAAWLNGAEAKIDFVKEIQPIFEKSCIKCHGPEKQKGKLRLDSRDSALKRSGDDVVIVPGDASKSDLYRRVTLPKGDDDVMPNEGEPLSKAQTELIRDWINQGAAWPESAVAKEAKPAPSGPTLPADFKPSANELKAIAKFAQLGMDIRPIAMNVNWREANFRLHTTNVTDAVIAPLKEVAGLVDLNLGSTKVTDAGLAAIKDLSNLMRLHLELTQISDAGLVHLKNLTNLTYLNLYGTRVTDAGLEQLNGLKHLRNLYVWQTKVTEGGVAKLKQALPGVDVSTGWDISVLTKKEEKPAEKKEEEKK